MSQASLATGIDMVEIDRLAAAIERHGQHFLDRIFTSVELAECAGKAASLAARFAAKEATVKALGTGIGPVGWREVELRYGPEKQPQLFLHGAAAIRAEALGLNTWSVSISHTSNLAVAMVTALGTGD